MADPPRLELPRAINVQQFAAAREPELRGLWATLQALGQLDPRRLLPRHLRRRATSHRRYVCRRRPNLALAAGRSAGRAAAAANDAAAAAAPVVAAPGGSGDDMPPEGGRGPGAGLAAAGARPTNRRQRRRPALLQMELAERGCQAEPGGSGSDGGGSSNAGPRRLETHIWHARRMRMCTRFGHVLAAGAVGRGLGSRSLLQRALLGAPPPKPRSRFAQQSGGAAGSSGGGSAAEPAAAVWPAESGEPRPAPVRAVCHDASYWCALQLQGTQRELVGLLERMSDPAALRRQLCCREVLEGMVEAELVLHMPGQFPAGALGPATMLWHPLTRQQRQQASRRPEAKQRGQQPQQQPQPQLQQQQQEQQQQHEQQQQREQQQQEQQPGQRHRVRRRRRPGKDQMQLDHHQQQQQQPPDGQADEMELDQQPEQQQQQQAVTRREARALREQEQRRTLWLWCHGAFWQQATAAISGLVADAAGSGGGASSSSDATPAEGGPAGGVSVAPLCSSLRRIEVVGPSADWAVRSVVQQQQQHLGGGDAWAALAASPLAAWQRLPAGCVVGVEAVDPRLAKPPRQAGAFGAPSTGGGSGGSGGGGGDSVGPSTSAAQSLPQLLNGWPQNGRRWLPRGHALLRGPAGLPAAAPEWLVSLWRKQQQQEALGLGPSWQDRTDDQQQQRAPCRPACREVCCSLQGIQVSPYGVTGRLAAAGCSTSGATRRRAGAAAGAAEQERAATARLPRSCPLLLVRRYWGPQGTPGWSLVLPAGWAMPFWMALTHTGAVPAGLREWSWIAATHGAPEGPLGFPDSAAAAAAAAELRAEALAAAARRPVGRLRLADHVLPHLDWGRLGQLLEVSGGGDSSGNSSGSRPPPAAVCWAGAGELQAAARAAKQARRQRRRLARRQERHRQQLAQLAQGAQRTPAGARLAEAAPGPQATTGCKQHVGGEQRRQRPEQQPEEPQLQQPQQQLNPQQQHVSLLPGGWFVARSWRVLLAALPSAAGAQVRPAGAVAAPPHVLASGRGRSRALDRAVQQGALAWAPAQAELAADAAAAPQGSHADPGPVDAMDVDQTPGAEGGAAASSAPPQGRPRQLQDQSAGLRGEQQQQQQQQRQHALVRVAVRVLGKGRCQPGALLLSAGPEASTSSAGGAAQAGASSRGGAGATCSSARSTGASDTAGSAAALLGFVTAAVPRGAPAGLYPGGSGFCSARGLWRQRCLDPSPAGSRVLRVWLLNPGSSALRRAELRVLLDSDGGA